MTLGKMCITQLVCVSGSGIWYQLIPLPISYLPETALGGLRMLLQEQVAKSVNRRGASAPGRTNVEIAAFNNIPHGIRKVFQMKSNKFLGLRTGVLQPAFLLDPLKFLIYL